ncbi:hypothetical protein HDA32_001434 [Spinactinospora alkalitolerans]|uniref:Uncharacterized protein n=1 Tax=Spinactinospora alkalitolerans TaxID=687207 RepID=A0A852TW65_9ACTN|nr:hypothetical protein [Spinactinospora alkalitolerans]
MPRTHISLSAAMRARDVSRPHADIVPFSAGDGPGHAGPGPVTGEEGGSAPVERQRSGSDSSADARKAVTGPDALVVPPAPRPKKRNRRRRRR